MSTARYAHRVAALTVATAIAAFGMAAPVAARPGPAATVLLEVRIRSGCVTAWNTTDGSTVKLIQKRAGRTLATTSAVATDVFVETCALKPILPGDSLVVAETVGDTTTSRKVLVPSFAVDVDRVADTLTVSVPLADTNVSYGVTLLTAGLVSGSVGSGGPTDGQGTVVWSPGQDLSGAIGVGAFPVAIDTFELVDASPSLAVQAGSAIVRGTGSYGDRVTVRLRSGAGVLKATATVRITSGREPRFSATLRSAAGAKVKAAPGDSISLSTIPGKRLLVRANNLQVDPDSGGGGSLTATCAPGIDFVVQVNGAWTSVGTVPGNGAIAVDPILGGPDPLGPGTRIQVGCEAASGLGQVMSLVTN